MQWCTLKEKKKLHSECQRKHKQPGDYIPIKILAALTVIDMAEILATARGKQENVCMSMHTDAPRRLRALIQTSG